MPNGLSCTGSCSRMASYWGYGSSAKPGSKGLYATAAASVMRPPPPLLVTRSTRPIYVTRVSDQHFRRLGDEPHDPLDVHELPLVGGHLLGIGGIVEEGGERLL